MSEQLPPLVSHDSLRIITAAAQVRADTHRAPLLVFKTSFSVASDRRSLCACVSGSTGYRRRLTLQVAGICRVLTIAVGYL